MIKAPCLNCCDRVIGCHSSCERYSGYKEAMRAAKQNKNDDLRYTYTYGKEPKKR